MALAESDCPTHVEKNGNNHLSNLSEVRDILSESIEYKRQERCLTLKDKIFTEHFILGVDEFSTLFFPVAFAVFNAAYWFSIRHML